MTTLSHTWLYIRLPATAYSEEQILRPLASQKVNVGVVPCYGFIAHGVLLAVRLDDESIGALQSEP